MADEKKTCRIRLSLDALAAKRADLSREKKTLMDEKTRH